MKRLATIAVAMNSGSLSRLMIGKFKVSAPAILFAVLVFMFLQNGLGRIWMENFHHAEDEYCKSYADVAAGLKGEDVAYVGGRRGSPFPLDREILAQVAWEVSPGSVSSLGLDEVSSWQGAVVGPTQTSPESEEVYELSGYKAIAYNECATLRSRIAIGQNPRENHAPRGHSVKGLSGAFAVILAVFVFWLWMHSGGRPALPALLLAVLVFVLLSSASLRFGLTAPNGLATYAGKAKLFLLSHGVPDGFWTSPAYSVYQPSYPPGMVVPAAIDFLVDDTFSIFWIQTLVPFVLALVFMELASFKRPILTALAFAYTLCIISVKLAIGFYAEPLCALFLILGWKKKEQGSEVLGWALVGISSLIRLEGLLLAAVFWCVDAMRHRRFNWTTLFAALLPGMAWQLITAVLGTHLDGFSICRMPDVHEVVMAILKTLNSHLFGFDGSGMMFLAFLAFLMLGAMRSCASMSCAIVLSVLAAVVLLGFFAEGTLGWMVDTAFYRFLWLASAIPLCEVSVVALKSESRKDLDANR